ncbi:hypothetical protein QR680_006216 [Steinernema hermaphroditum]|uniref:Uncharacterized protein n=1 Tax=Steinernema hermaphroditum TaxID=289476 RepID=A0AA39HWX8_9BILA|nr:hypothetical protein QR680_006216 [Steinernema hermaphroditum]
MAGYSRLVHILTDIDVVLQYPVLVLSILILVMSAKVVSKSLARLFVTNIAFQSFMSTLLYVAQKIFFENPRGPRKIFDGLAGIVRGMYIFFRASTLNGYLYFSTLTVFLSYIGYGKPTLFAKLTEYRTVVVLFLVGYVWTIVNVCLELPRILFSDFMLIFPGNTYFTIPMWLHFALSAILYSFTIALYITTITQIQSIRRVLKTTKSTSSLRRHWFALKSILIYCTPPNVFIAVALAGFACDSYTETRGLFMPQNWKSEEDMKQWTEQHDVCSDIRVWSQTSTNIRLFVTSFTALIAFREYRKAIQNSLVILWNFVVCMRIVPKFITKNLRISKAVFVTKITAMSSNA